MLAPKECGEEEIISFMVLIYPFIDELCTRGLQRHKDSNNTAADGEDCPAGGQHAEGFNGVFGEVELVHDLSIPHAGWDLHPTVRGHPQER